MPDIYATCDYCRGPFIPKNGESECGHCCGPDEWDDSDDLGDERDDSIERALDECGQMADGSCLMVGSEFCDWDCPFSRI